MKPEVGGLASMAQEEFDPLDMLSKVALLVVEARTPHPSAKGRVEGPHCPSPAEQRGQHACIPDRLECSQAQDVRQRIDVMWRNGIPSCMDILLFPNCEHGKLETRSLDGTVGEREETSLLLERWSIKCVKKWQGEWREGVAGSMLLQAVRSYLYFSQLSSWLTSMHGHLPGYVAYRLYAPGDCGDVDFAHTPLTHVFPSAIYGPHGLKVTVMYLPRLQIFPMLQCTYRRLPVGTGSLERRKTIEEREQEREKERGEEGGKGKRNITKRSDANKPEQSGPSQWRSTPSSFQWSDDTRGPQQDRKRPHQDSPRPVKDRARPPRQGPTAPEDVSRLTRDPTRPKDLTPSSWNAARGGTDTSKSLKDTERSSWNTARDNKDTSRSVQDTSSWNTAISNKDTSIFLKDTDRSSTRFYQDRKEHVMTRETEDIATSPWTTARHSKDAASSLKDMTRLSSDSTTSNIVTRPDMNKTRPATGKKRTPENSPRSRNVTRPAVAARSAVNKTRPTVDTKSSEPTLRSRNVAKTSRDSKRPEDITRPGSHFTGPEEDHGRRTLDRKRSTSDSFLSQSHLSLPHTPQPTTPQGHQILSAVDLLTHNDPQERVKVRKALEGQLRPLELTPSSATATAPTLDLHSPKVLMSEALYNPTPATRRMQLRFNQPPTSSAPLPPPTPFLNDPQLLLTHLHHPNPLYSSPTQLELSSFLLNLQSLTSPVSPRSLNPTSPITYQFSAEKAVRLGLSVPALNTNQGFVGDGIPAPSFSTSRSSIGGGEEEEDPIGARFRKKRALPFGGDPPPVDVDFKRGVVRSGFVPQPSDMTLASVTAELRSPCDVGDSRFYLHKLPFYQTGSFGGGYPEFLDDTSLLPREKRKRTACLLPLEGSSQLRGVEQRGHLPSKSVAALMLSHSLSVSDCARPVIRDLTPVSKTHQSVQSLKKVISLTDSWSSSSSSSSSTYSSSPKLSTEERQSDSSTPTNMSSSPSPQHESESESCRSKLASPGSSPLTDSITSDHASELSGLDSDTRGTSLTAEVTSKPPSKVNKSQSDLRCSIVSENAPSSLSLHVEQTTAHNTMNAETLQAGCQCSWCVDADLPRCSRFHSCLRSQKLDNDMKNICGRCSKPLQGGDNERDIIQDDVQSSVSSNQRRNNVEKNSGKKTADMFYLESPSCEDDSQNTQWPNVSEIDWEYSQLELRLENIHLHDADIKTDMNSSERSIPSPAELNGCKLNCDIQHNVSSSEDSVPSPSPSSGFKLDSDTDIKPDISSSEIAVPSCSYSNGCHVDSISKFASNQRSCYSSAQDSSQTSQSSDGSLSWTDQNVSNGCSIVHTKDAACPGISIPKFSLVPSCHESSSDQYCSTSKTSISHLIRHGRSGDQPCSSAMQNISHTSHSTAFTENISYPTYSTASKQNVFHSSHSNFSNQRCSSSTQNVSHSSDSNSCIDTVSHSNGATITTEHSTKDNAGTTLESKGTTEEAMQEDDSVFYDKPRNVNHDVSSHGPTRTKSAPSFSILSEKAQAREEGDVTVEEKRGRSVLREKEAGRMLGPDRLRHRLVKSATMLFNSRGSLPSQSSPAPVKRRSSGRFDYDETLTSAKAIKSAISLSGLPDATKDSSDSLSQSGRVLSTSAPASTNCLLGNFEESMLNGRLEAAGVVEGFTVDIGASGQFCPRHVTLPVTAYFFHLSDDNAPSPYLGHINLEQVGKRGYHIPTVGTLQVTLFNPNKTVVKMFVVKYDLQDMPANSQTVLRQRTVYLPVDPESDLPAYLRYLIHLRIWSSSSRKIYLHTDLRLIFARNKFELDSSVAQYELRSYTETPVNPKYSPKR